MMSDSKSNLRILWFALQPSVVSGVAAFLISFITVAIAMVSTITDLTLKGIHLTYSFRYYTDAITTVDTYIANNPYLNNAPIVIFWGLLGFVSYLIVDFLAKGLRNAKEIEEEMHYVHADKRSLLTEAAVHIIVRADALVAWWFLFQWILYTVMPDLVASARLSVIAPSMLSSWGQLAIEMLIAMIGLHGLTVLLRLMMLKPRLFDNEAMFGSGHDVM